MKGDEFLPLNSVNSSNLQLKVFARWCNVQLQDTNKKVGTLATDLRNGVILVELVQALTGEKLFGVMPNPYTPQDAIRNIQISLNALAADGVEFEGVDAILIERGDVLQVLRLLWIIILRYQVTLWDEQGIVENDPVNSLMSWLESHVNQLNTREITKGWNDGKFLTLIVNSVAPGLCPGGFQAHPENGLMFLVRAMDRAECWLGVPQILLPSELHDVTHLDTHSLLTYLSLYRHAELLKDGAPLCFPEKSFAIGPGITGENVIPEFITSFDIDCRRSGLGDLIVKISVDNEKVPYKVNVTGGVVNISYIPPTPGMYTIEILLEHEPMPGFPKSFCLEASKSHPAHLIKLSGPGLETGLVTGQQTYFTMTYDRTQISPDNLLVQIYDENGIEFTEHVLTHRDGSSTLQYTPPCNGIFEINVFYQQVKVPRCPSFVTVLPDMQKIVFADIPNHFIPGLMGSFVIKNVTEAGKGKLRIKVHPENRPTLPIQVKDLEAGTMQVFITPSLSVDHRITVSLAGTKKESVTVPCYPCVGNIMITNLPQAFVVNKKVTFNVDCTKAGIGELFVNILDANMKSVPEAELVLLLEEYFEISYTPRQAGVYSIFISYDSVPLESMPLEHTVEDVAPTDPYHRQSSDTEVSQLLPVRPGHPHSIRIELKDLDVAPKGSLVVSITKYDGTIIPSKLDKITDFSYVAHFCLPTVGDYAISALLNLSQLPGFPYKISAIPDLGKITFDRDLSKEFHEANKVVAMVVNTLQAGIAQLEVTVQDSTDQQLANVTCTALEMSKYLISFTPLYPEIYQLTLKYGTFTLPGMPLTLTVHEDQLNKIKVEGYGVAANQFCTEVTSFAVLAEGISWSDVELSVVAPNKAAIPVDTTHDNNKMTVKYKAMYPGAYAVSVVYNKVHIQGSPFRSNVVPNVRNAQLIPGKTSTVSIGKELSFQVNCTAVAKGAFTAKVFPPKGDPFSPTVNECEHLTFDVTFKVMYEGQYGIELRHCGVFLPMSPYIFKPTRDKRELRVSGLGKNQKMRPGDLLKFEIDTSQFNTGYPEVYFSDSDNNPVTNYTMTQTDVCKYLVTFKPTTVGTFSIAIKKENRYAQDSPYSLVSAINTSKVTFTGKGVTDKTLSAGVPAEFLVNVAEAGLGDLRVDILDPEYRPVLVDVKREGDLANVTCTPLTVGQYTVYVRLCESLLPPSPFQISVVAPVENASKMIITKNSPDVLATGEKISLAISARDIAMGSVDVLAEVIGREIELEPVVEYENNILSVVVPTPISGKYAVFIKYEKKDIPGSPFRILAKSNALKITASGPGLEASGVPSKKNANFLIHLNGEKPSNIVVNVIDPYGYYVDDVVSESASENVKVNYLPMKTGLYIVEILCDDEHITGSPFNVNAEEVIDSSQLQMSGNMTEKNIFQFQEDACLVVDYSNAGDGHLEANVVETNNGTLFQPSITELEPRRLCIAFPTYQAGNFEVSILYNGKHAPYSPFNYLVISKGSEKVEIEESHDFNVTVHETLRIPVNTKNAGIGKLTSKCHHVRSKTSCKLQTVPKSDGNYDIIFQAPQPGEYLLHVYFNNDEVPNSPVMVIAKSQPEAGNYRLDSACTRGIKGEMRFTIHGKETTKLVVRCLDPVGEPTLFNLNYSNNDIYTLEVLPDSSGEYLLEVYFNGFLITGCPKSFEVKMKQTMEYTSIVVPDLDNLELNVNQSVTFPIKIIGPDDGVLRVLCKDPNGQELDLEMQREEGSVLITFRPLKSGIHELSVLLNNVHVAGSPFKLHITKPDGAKSCTVKQEGIINGVVKLKVIKKCGDILQVSGVGPHDNEIQLKVSHISSEISCVDFTPTDLGVYTIDILVDGVFIRGSPIEIDVQTLDPIMGDIDIVENDSSECDSVTSLQKAIVYLQLPEKMPQMFDIKCLDKHGNEVVVEKIKSDQKSATVRFQPVERGHHILQLLCANNDKPIHSYSVFVQEITSHESMAYAASSDFRARAVTPEVVNKFNLVSGENIRKPVFIGVPEPTTFILKDWIGCSIPYIRICDVENNKVLSHTVSENEDKTYAISCMPKIPGRHKIEIYCDSKPLPGTPLFFEALVVQGSDGVILTGPGLQTFVQVMEFTEFNIDARNAGPGTIEVTVCNSFGYLPVEIEDRDDYTYTVKYQPITIGDYTVEVLFNGTHAPSTPAQVKVVSSLPQKKFEPKIKRKVKRKDEPIFDNSVDMTEFVVIYETKSPIKFKIMNIDAEEIVKYKARRHRDGTFSLICRPTKAGSHIINVYEDGKLITTSPYKFYVCEGKGTTGVAVAGPGVTDGIHINKETYFTIDTNEAGPGVLEVAVTQGKTPIQVSVSSKSDYIFTCKYIPTSPKYIKVSVLFDKIHVVGSPWRMTTFGKNESFNGDQEYDDLSERSLVSIPIMSRAAFCSTNVKSKEKSEATSERLSSSSLPTLSFSLPIKVTMDSGQKYIKLLLPINDLPPLSNPKVYHTDSNSKIPAAIVFSRHGYVLKCCPSQFGKYKVNVFDRSVESVDPLVFFYFNYVESIRPCTAKLYALRSIHPTDYFPIEANSVCPNEIELTCRTLKIPVNVNTMCVFIIKKAMLNSPANVTIANKSTNQYIYTKTVMRDDENPGIMCYPTAAGDYQITIYPTSTESIELNFEFTVIRPQSDKTTTSKCISSDNKVHQETSAEARHQKHPVASNCTNTTANICHQTATSSGIITTDTHVEVRNMDTGVHVPATIKTRQTGEYTIQCEPTDSGKYIVTMSINGRAVAGSPMYFTIDEDKPLQVDQQYPQTQYNISGEVRHCTQELTFNPDINLLPNDSFRLPCSIQGSDLSSPIPSTIENDIAIKPCSNVFKSLVDRKNKFFLSDEVSDRSISENTPTHLLNPVSEIKADHPIKIMLPYFPDRANIIVFNEAASKVIRSEVVRKNNGTMILDCHVTEEGRHRVDVYIDGKMASCGPLYFDVSSWDSATLGIPFTSAADVDCEFYDNFVVSNSFGPMQNSNDVIHEEFIVGFAFEDVDQAPVSLSSFSEDSSDEDHDRQEIRIQSSLELEALSVFVVNEDTGELLRARLIERNGDYVVRCRPTVPGHYRVNVRDGHDDVEGSPFFFDVLPQQSSSSPIPQSEYKSPHRLERSPNTSEKVSSRREIYFLNPGQCDFERTFSSVGEAEIVFCASSLNNPKISLAIEGLDIDVPTHIQDNNDGTFTLRFAPPNSGRYKLEVWDEHQSLPGSPFYFDVNETATISAPENTVYVTQKGQLCTGHKSEYSCFRVPSSQPLDVAIVLQKSGEKISYKLVNDDVDFSTIICKPYNSGKYTVSVRNRDTNRELGISPFYFEVPEPHIPREKIPRSDSPIDGMRHEHLTVKSSSIKTNTSGLIFVSDAQTHYLTRRSESPKFVVPAIQAPDVTIKDIVTGSDILFTITSHDHNSYLLEVPNRTPGKYSVTATINNKAIPGTPFTFQVPDTSSATTEIVSTSGIFELQNIDECIRRGDPIVLTIVADEHPITRVTNLSTRETIHVDVAQIDETTHTITFCPFKSGRHEVMIKCQGIQVSGSPFYLDVDSVTLNNYGSVGSLDMKMSQSMSSKLLSPEQRTFLAEQNIANITKTQCMSAKYTVKSGVVPVDFSSSSESSFSSTEFDDTTSTIFSDFTETTHKLNDISSSESVESDKAVFIKDQTTKMSGSRTITARKKVDYTKLSVQRQLKSKMKEDANIIHHSTTFNQLAKDRTKNFFTQEESTTFDHSMLKDYIGHKTEESVHSHSLVTSRISSPEISDEEIIIDPFHNRYSATCLELGKTVCIKISNTSLETVVKNLDYGYQINHRKIQQKFGACYIRFKPLFDGKYKLDCQDSKGSVDNFPMILTVNSVGPNVIKNIDPSGFIPRVYISDIVTIQVFARSQPKYRVEFMNRKVKIYSCLVDEGMDKYLLCFQPTYIGKYRITASDASGHLSFSPLTLDVFEKEEKHGHKHVSDRDRGSCRNRIYIKSYRGQEDCIIVGGEINVSIMESTIHSTFVSVMKIDTQKMVPFTLNNTDDEKVISFSPECKGGYAVSIVGEDGHYSYSPIILYVEDDISPDWRIYLKQLQEQHQHQEHRHSPVRSRPHSPHTSTSLTTKVNDQRTTISQTTTNESCIHQNVTPRRITSPVRCVSPDACPFLNKCPPSSDNQSGLRSPSRITFNVESKVDEHTTCINEQIIDATLIMFEQESPEHSPAPSPPMPEICEPNEPEEVIKPHIDIVYPTSENELLKLYIYGVDQLKSIPFIIVTHIATLNQMTVYTKREGKIIIVRMKPYHRGSYSVELFENGAVLPFSPFIINLQSEFLIQHTVDIRETTTEIKDTTDTIRDFIKDVIEENLEHCTRNETRQSYCNSDFGDTIWDNDLVECDIVNKRVDNVTISSKSLRFSATEPAITTSFDLDFEVKEEHYEKISPEPLKDIIPPLIMSVDLPKYPAVTVIDIDTKEELHVNVTKDDDSYNIEGQPTEPGNFKIDVRVDGEHILESPFYIEISKNEPSKIIFASMKPPSPRPEDIIMMQKKMRRKPKKKKKKIDPSIPFLDGRPIDPVHLPAPGLFKDNNPIVQQQDHAYQGKTTTTSTTKTSTTTTSHTTHSDSFTRSRRSVSSNNTAMSDSHRGDHYNNKLCDFNDAKDELTKDMQDLKLYMEKYLEQGIESDLSDTDDGREGYRSANQRRLIFIDENSPFEIDVFSKETKSMEFGFKVEDTWCENIIIFLANEQSHMFIKTRLEKLDQDDEYSCYTRIHESGRYILEIFHDDKRLFDRRFYLKANMAMGAEGLNIWGPGFHGPVVIDTETWFFISFKQSGPGVLSCIYHDIEEEPISLHANETEQDVYQFKFTPTRLGPIDVDITFDEEDTPGIPKQIECIRKPQLSNGATKFDLFYHKPEEIEITVQDFRGHNIEPHVIPLDSHDISVTFTPQVPGDHTVSAQKKSNNKHIKGSPINILIKDESILQEEFIVYFAEDPFTGFSNVKGSVSARQQYVFAKDPIQSEFLFTCKEPFTGTFSVFITNIMTNRSVSSDVTSEDEFNRVIKFKCSTAGKHKLVLTVNGLMLAGCPLFFHCIDGLGAAGVRASGQGYTGPHHEEMVNVFTINTGLAGPGVLEVLLKDKNTSISVDIKDTEDGKLLCSYVPHDSPVFMEILFDNNHIPGSPRVVPSYEGFMTDSDSESDGDDVVGVESSTKDVEYFYVNENAEMDLDYDGIGDLKVEVVNFENENIKIKGKCTALSTGRYVITFKPKTKGLHMVEVFDGDYQLSNSPFFVTVLESRGKLAIEFYGPGIMGPLVLNRRTAFTVNTSGAGAGVLEVLVQTEDDTVPVTVEDNFNDSITCYYTPSIWSDHTISVLYNKEHVKSSPVILRVYTDDPNKKSADDLDNGFVVKVPPRSFEYLFVEVEDPDGDLVESTFSPLGVDCLKICFETPIHGLYMCNIYFHNVHIKGSPIEILVGDTSGGKPLVPAGPGNYPKSLKPINVNEPSQIRINAAYKLRLDVEIKHEVTQNSLPSVIKYVEHGTHFIIFTPTDLGGHIIDIQVKGASLPGCPLVVEAVKAAGAQACTLDGLADNKDCPDKNKFAPFGDLDEFGDFVDDVNDNDPNKNAILNLFNPGTGGGRRRTEMRKVLKFKAHLKKKVVVDTRECGEGILQVSIASNAGEVPVKIKQNPNDTYLVSFTPNADGLLKISITFNGDDIPGSPYLAIVGTPEQNTIDFNRFTVHCYSPKGNIVPSQLYQTTEGNVKLKFKPDEPGQYKVDILNGSAHIKGSPFVIHVQNDEIKEEKNTFDIQAPGAILLTELHNEIIYARDTLTILLLGPPKDDGIMLTFMPTHEMDTSWRLITLADTNIISWKPERGGQYKFEITGREGDCTIYLVDVITVIVPEKCIVRGPAFEQQLTVSDTTHFIVDCENSGNNSVSVIIKDDNGKIPILVEEITPFTWKCTFHPISAGDHIVVLHLDKILYIEKLLKFVVYKKSEGTCTVTDMSPPIASVGVTIRIVVNLETVTADDVIISVYDPDYDLLECSAKTFDGENVNLEFIAEKEGCHKVNVSSRGSQLDGSPFTIDIQGKDSGTTTPLSDKLIMKMSNTEVVVGDGDSVITKNTMDAKLQSAMRLATQFDIDKNNNVISQPKVLFKPNLRKSREVRVESPALRLASPVLTVVSEMNETINQPHSRSISKSDTRTTSESAVLVGDEVNFVIRNVSSTDYNIDINGPPGFSSYCYSNFDKITNTVSFRYVPEDAGTYSVRLFNKDIEIAESPIEFKVIALPTQKIHLVVQGEGLSHGTLDKPAVFDVITNSSGNLTVSIDGPRETKMYIADRESGGCRVTYYPAVPGDYLIHLEYAGVRINGSPYKAVISRPIPKDKPPPIIPPPDKVYVKEPYVVHFPRAADIGDLMVSVGGPDGISTKVQLAEEENTHSISYIPVLPGKYQLIVNLPYGPVMGSPFNFTAIPKLSLECTCDGRPLKGMKIKDMGSLVISYNLPNPRAISYEMIGPVKLTLQVSRRSNADIVDFTPRKPGEYKLYVKYNNTVLRRSPFSVNVVDLCHFNFLDLQDSLNSVILNKNVVLTLNTSKCGPGKVKAQLEGPTRYEQVKVDNVPGTATIRFKTTKPGHHKLVLYYDTIQFPSSPFAFLVPRKTGGKISNMPMEGSGLKMALVNKANYIYVNNVPKGTGLQVEVLSANKTLQEVRVNSGTSGTCTVEYYVSSPGVYTINMTWEGTPLAGSPFTVPAVAS